MKHLATLGLFGSLASASKALKGECGNNDSSQFDPNCYASDNVITRDVAVIGGGSSGTYGAVNLGDLGNSVVVVEKESVLGGHTNTYTVPDDGTKIDYGVMAFWNTSAVIDFFARFDVPLAPLSFPGATTTVYADFETGESLPSFNESADLSAYIEQLDKYPYLLEGWELPSPVPEDLLLPFGEFVEKYSLQDIAYALYNSPSIGGVGNILDQLTVTVFKGINHSYLEELKGAGVTSANHDNHEVYDKALAELGSDVLLDSTVVAMDRPTNSSDVRIVVQTPTGNKLIVASQILVTIPQTLDNMTPFDLDQREQSLLEQLDNTAYYCGLVSSTGLPAGYGYVNAAADTPYNIPVFPAMYHISPTAVDGIYSFWYGADSDLAEADIKDDISVTIQRLGNSSTVEPEFVAYSSHTPFNLHVPADAIDDGFYNSLNKLQGYRNTWYTGQLFTPSAGPLWVFTQELLPKITAAI